MYTTENKTQADCCRSLVSTFNIHTCIYFMPLWCALHTKNATWLRPHCRPTHFYYLASPIRLSMAVIFNRSFFLIWNIFYGVCDTVADYTTFLYVVQNILKLLSCFVWNKIIRVWTGMELIICYIYNTLCVTLDPNVVFWSSNSSGYCSAYASSVSTLFDPSSILHHWF